MRKSLLLFTLLCFGGISCIERDVTFPINAGTEECFYETALVGQVLEVDYQVMDDGSDGVFAIDFIITKPDGRPVLIESDKTDSTHQVPIF